MSAVAPGDERQRALDESFLNARPWSRPLVGSRNEHIAADTMHSEALPLEEAPQRIAREAIAIWKRQQVVLRQQRARRRTFGAAARREPTAKRNIELAIRHANGENAARSQQFGRRA